MIKYILGALLIVVPAMADESVCVVIHQTGFIRNPTPDELERGMRIPCDENTDSITALNFYLAHGGH